LKNGAKIGRGGRKKGRDWPGTKREAGKVPLENWPEMLYYRGTRRNGGDFL